MYFRSQNEGIFDLGKTVNMIHKMDFNIEKLSTIVSRVNGNIQALGERTHNLQESFEKSNASDTKKYSKDVLGKLSKIESGITTLSGSSHSRKSYKRHHNRNSGNRRNETDGIQICKGNQTMLKNIHEIIKTVWQTMNQKDSIGQGLPRFEYLRSDDRSDASEYQFGARENENRVTHLQRMAIPFKRMNKRLSEIRTDVQTGNDDIQRQISDLKAMSSELSHEHNILLQGYSKDFA